MTACDCNGDGFGDLVINDSGNGDDVTGFRFFRGGAGGLEDPGAGTFVQRPEYPTGIAGDVDGDGVMDLVTAEGLKTTLVLFRGGPGFPGSPVQTIALTERVGSLQLGDFDGDGEFDLAATTSTQTSIIYFTDDRIDLYRGGPNGLAPTPVRTIQETSVLPDNQLNFGERLGSADFDGDGREDLLVGAPPPTPTPYFANSPSAVFVFEGAAHGLGGRCRRPASTAPPASAPGSAPAAPSPASEAGKNAIGPAPPTSSRRGRDPGALGDSSPGVGSERKVLGLLGCAEDDRAACELAEPPAWRTRAQGGGGLCARGTGLAADGARRDSLHRGHGPPPPARDRARA